MTVTLHRPGRRLVMLLTVVGVAVMVPHLARRPVAWELRSQGHDKTVIASAAGNARQVDDQEATRPDDRVAASEQLSPMPFVQNRGQWSADLSYLAQVGGLKIGLVPAAIVVNVANRARQGSFTLRFALEGATTQRLVGEDPLPGHHNYFVGGDPDRWQRRLATHGRVRYVDAWPGVDLVVHGLGPRVQYDLHLAEDAPTESISMRVEGVDAMQVARDGSLVLQTALGPVVQSPPVAWEEDAKGRRHPIDCSYRLLGDTRFGFDMPGRRRDRSAVIDPGLDWSTLLGSPALEGLVGESLRVATANDGDVLVFGGTAGADFPLTPGAFHSTFTGSGVTYVSRFQSDGGSLVFSTFIGSETGTGAPHAFVLDGEDRPTMALGTVASDMPTTPGAYQPTKKGVSDVYVARLDASGGALDFGTYLGGNDVESPTDLAVEESGCIVVVGWTESTDYPVTPGAHDTMLAGRDNFVSRLSADGTRLVRSTLLGGSSSELSRLYVAIDGDGSVVVAGGTLSGDFPVTPGAYDTQPPGGFVTRFDPTLSRLIWSTILDCEGTCPSERLLDVAVDAAGAVTVAGYTQSAQWPTTPSAFDTVFGPPFDLFVTRLDSTGSSLEYSTYIGGSSFEHNVRFDMDSAGTVTLVGTTNSSSQVPITVGSHDVTMNGDEDVIVVRLAPVGSQVWYGSYLGGSSEDGSAIPGYVDVALFPDGSAAIAGVTRSRDFPVTPGAFDQTFNGIRDVFVSKLSMLPLGVERVGGSTFGCAGFLAAGVTAMPQVGGPFGLTCTNAPPSSTQGVLALGFGVLAVPLRAKGAQLWVDPSPLLLLVPASSDALGFCWLQGALPNDPALAGAGLAAQFFWPDPCVPGGSLSASNALSIAIQP